MSKATPENADLYTVLSVWTAWPPAQETKGFTFKLQAKLLPRMPTSMPVYLFVTIKGSFIARMPLTDQSLNRGPEAMAQPAVTGKIEVR